MLHSNLAVNSAGHLLFGGADTVELVTKYGTPLYVMDENTVKANCRRYLDLVKKYFPENSTVLYASKALCCIAMYKLMAKEEMCCDVVSAGELYTAMRAGFPAEKLFFHGNSKPDNEIEYAIDMNIGHFVVDSMEELSKIDEYAERKDIKQKILLRITPNIDAHTHKKIATGSLDCKFGTPIVTGQAEELLRCALEKKNITVEGFHAHIGSQIFDEEPYYEEVDVMSEFVSDMYKKLGYLPKYLNLGGGFGVRYTEKDPEPDLENVLKNIAKRLEERFSDYEIPLPAVLFEPGRSIVADAGLTLYTVTNVKEIPGRNGYVAVDGGMNDNIRYAMYSAEHSMIVANRAKKEPDTPFTVAGRCCESGDLLGENVLLVKPQKGDTLAVLTTGAYTYSMASNYNRNPRPAMIGLRDGKDRMLIRRESYEDLVAFDIL